MRCKRVIKRICCLVLCTIGLSLFYGCANTSTEEGKETQETTQKLLDQESATESRKSSVDTNETEDTMESENQGLSQEELSRLEGYFEGIATTKPLKTIINNNPLMTQS